MREAQWMSVGWGECHACGGAAEVLTTLEGEKAFDGDLARCTDCGCPGNVSVDDSLDAPDGDDGVASIQWHDEPDCDCWWCKTQNQLDTLRAANARMLEALNTIASFHSKEPAGHFCNECGARGGRFPCETRLEADAALTPNPGAANGT